MTLSFRKHLNAPSLINTIYKEFAKIPDEVSFSRKPSISLTDHLMSGLAVFGLKCPSLLDFERQKIETPTENNLRDLYHVNRVPSDTYLRKRLDDVSPKHLRSAFKKLFTDFQRGKVLERYEFLDGHILLSGDGTGQFHSNKISCPPPVAKRNLVMEASPTTIKCLEFVWYTLKRRLLPKPALNVISLAQMRRRDLKSKGNPLPKITS